VKKTARLIWNRLVAAETVELVSLERRERLWLLIMRCISAVSVTGSRVVANSATWITSAVRGLRIPEEWKARLTFSKNSRKSLTLP